MTPSTVSPASFMTNIASRDGSFLFATFALKKNILVAPVVMINPSLVEFSMFFFPAKTSHLLYRFFNIRSGLPRPKKGHKVYK